MYLLKMIITTIVSLSLIQRAVAQVNPIYEYLPVGKYQVGFRIITIVDSSRITKPEFNYLGEKNEGDRTRSVTIHLWYPAKKNDLRPLLRYEDYCYNHILKSTNETAGDSAKNAEIFSKRRSVENWFGKTSDENWRRLMNTPMLAHSNAEMLPQKFPLLVGMLRPLSTSIVNELMASNGYVVAMVSENGFSSFASQALDAIPDMRLAILFLQRKGVIDVSRIGTFGFSGSGFSQVLFSMADYRVKAVADIESGIYMDQLYQNFSASNYYAPSRLRVPFLHIFSRDLSKQEKFIGEFEEKAKFSRRYRLLLNQPGLHHWDFAAEGFTAAIFLENRGAQAQNIRHCFEISALYLLRFFDAVLKDDTASSRFLSDRPGLKDTPDSLWSITTLAPSKPAPTAEEFQWLIRTKGLEMALSVLRETAKNDSLSDVWQPYVLNGWGYSYLAEKKYKEAIDLFVLNTEMHPDDANLFDSLAEGYELSGDKEKMKKMSEKVMLLLNKKDTLSEPEKGLKKNAEKRLSN